MRPALVCSTLVTAIFTLAIHVLAAALDDDHRAVVQVAHALARLLARLDDPHFDRLAGQEHRLQGVGQVVEVDHAHAVQLGHLVEVVVVGDDLAVQVLGQQHELQIDRLAGELGQLAIEDLQIDVARCCAAG